ncbi:sulfatase [Pelagicoccus sp. NFK12]|uniref:Sulfatase n=1 Tax=Pelagicoccus enzymogenes TaxID=2773457 RepID=A0A927FAY6_9BACT|nr:MULTISPECIES: sulfatase [Pelagicoccus]MBD5781627.1 sulfatase [Pelagicoccus enzymogenes]MDQ8181148.1 sulfatase [Pelagicoccus sp. SDUM812005]
MKQAPTPKNLVFILADDLGWMDTEPYGSTFYQTPNINRIAAKGMKFTDAYSASPLCSPTRASILTGRNPGRLHFTMPTGHEIPEILEGREHKTAPADQRAAAPTPINRLSLDYRTIGADLKKAGYHNALMGKWHLGHAPHIPENFGFDTVVGGRHHSGPPTPGNFFAPWDCDTLPEVEEGTHITDVLGDQAVKFIEDKRSDPFFLCLWLYDVHAPFQSKPDLKAKYEKRVDDAERQRNPNMGAMVDILDQNVGKVLDALERLGLQEDTIVVFTSDNGGNMYDVVEGTYPTSNFPLRSGKGNNYEGGVRIPLIVHWPGVAERPTVNDSVVSTTDFYPTFLEMLGQAPAPEAHLDGVSFVPALRSQPHDRGPLFSHFPHFVPATMNLPNTSVRKGSWKLYRFYHDTSDQKHRYELYNLAEDIGEQNDLSGQRNDIVEELDALIEQNLQASQCLLPHPNADYKGNVAGVWIGSESAKVQSQKGGMQVDYNGEDPSVTTRVTPSLFEPGILRFSCETTEEISIAVSFTDGQERVRLQPIELSSPCLRQHCEIDLPVETALSKLSLHLSPGNGRVRFESIELWTPKQELLTKYEFPSS